MQTEFKSSNRSNSTNYVNVNVDINDAKSALNDIPKLLNELRNELSNNESEYSFGDEILVKMLEAMSCEEFEGKFIKKINFNLDNQIDIKVNSKADGEMMDCIGNDDGNGNNFRKQFLNKTLCLCESDLSVNICYDNFELNIKINNNIARVGGTNREKIALLIKKIGNYMNCVLNFINNTN
jgi:hypothetical protein